MISLLFMLGIVLFVLGWIKCFVTIYGFGSSFNTGFAMMMIGSVLITIGLFN